MKKNTKDTIWALLILAAVFVTGLGVGQEVGFSMGFDEGVAVNHGDKWNCAYSYTTGFLMCDRTPKYK